MDFGKNLQIEDKSWNSPWVQLDEYIPKSYFTPEFHKVKILSSIGFTETTHPWLFYHNYEHFFLGILTFMLFSL